MNGELLKRISLLPRAQAVSVGDSVFSEEQRNLIAEAYQSLLGKQIPNCSCRNRYTDALISICATFKIKTNMSNKYQLFAGVIIWIGTDCYSNHNLTDEIAEKYLAMHPEAREKEFQAWPQEETKEPANEPEPADNGQGDNDPAPEDEGSDEGKGDEPEPEPEPEPEAKPKSKKGK
jgi:hypothetical protein